MKKGLIALIVIAIVAVLVVMSINVMVNMISNPDYLYELLWNFDADEGHAYCQLQGTTLIVANRPGFGKKWLGSSEMEEWNESVTKVVIKDEIAPLSIHSWFRNMTNLKTIEGLEKLDMSRTTYIQCMFENCKSLKKLDGIDGWDTSSLVNVDRMFSGCESLTYLDLSNWDMRNVESLLGMFSFSGLVEVKGMENWNITKLYSATRIFYGCKNLQKIGNLNNWKVANNFSGFYAFYGCTSLRTIRPYWAD